MPLRLYAPISYAVGDAIISMEQRRAFDPERATQTIEIDVEI
jgi:hypothetical protein